jgi:hypothetical protein
MTFIFVGVAVVSGVLYFMRRRARMHAEDND